MEYSWYFFLLDVDRERLIDCESMLLKWGRNSYEQAGRKGTSVENDGGPHFSIDRRLL